MKKNNPLITGTIILTITGFASRFIGFFYRIFLSRVFGAEGMGLYQLTSPVLALTFSITVSGMQTAISKYVASETSTRDYRSSFRTLLTGFGISMLLSAVCTAYIYIFSDTIAEKLLFEPPLFCGLFPFQSLWQRFIPVLTAIFMVFGKLRFLPLRSLRNRSCA